MKQVILGHLMSQGTVHRHTPPQTGTLPQLRAALSSNSPEPESDYRSPFGTPHHTPCQSDWQAKLLAKLPANLPDFISGYLPC